MILQSDGDAMAEFLASELATVRSARAAGHYYGVKLLTDPRHSADYFESLWGSRAAKDIEKCTPDRPPFAAGAEPLAEH